MKPKSIKILVLVVLTGFLAASCSAQNPGQSYQLAVLQEMPQEVQSAPVAVQQAYQFAVNNPEVLKEIPCYCGCGGMGHTSNYACYIKDDTSPDDLVFDGHALGCSICVDITQDTMDMLDQGMSLPEIRVEIDNIYSAFGPSNMP
ncbi:MAG: PCYCGC motif-containing (lipo)protein [Anaerolineales bacterium]